jgi:hypothetical protein
MPGASTTVDARAALAAEIKRRYGRKISGSLWSTVIPSDPPPDGLRSADADDWQITLENTSKRMTRQGYSMLPISLKEAEDQRTAALDGSVALLVSKAAVKPEEAAASRAQSKMKVWLGVGLGAAVLVALRSLACRARKDR